ncbi:MAG: DUF6172 family protein [Bacteriovorax sp.]|nr:DUF6172 family protein [Bacteriovorax sp.]
MKKSFNLTAPNKTPERQTDSVKHEIKKYITREQRKAVPANVDFWDFDVKMGDNLDTAAVIHVSEINKKIDSINLENKETFYLEILAKPGHRTNKKK